ncbi:MAG: toll/interleukin-1 receptor domain-containing protein [Ginsengibacter sp.]
MAIKIFIAYAHEDQIYKSKLMKHLTALRRLKYIETWTDKEIIPGQEWNEAIKINFNQASIILLLVSSDFLASDYSYTEEMTRAVERHMKKTARVVPIILRSCDWQNTVLSKLQALPESGKPISKWQDEDEAFLNIVEGLKKTIKQVDPYIEFYKLTNKFNAITTTTHPELRERVTIKTEQGKALGKYINENKIKRETIKLTNNEGALVGVLNSIIYSPNQSDKNFLFENFNKAKQLFTKYAFLNAIQLFIEKNYILSSDFPAVKNILEDYRKVADKQLTNKIDKIRDKLSSKKPPF